MAVNRAWLKYGGAVAGIALAICAYFPLQRWQQELANPVLPTATTTGGPAVGREVAVPHHLQDGAEERLPPADLLLFGQYLFMANWTEQDGAGPVVAPTPAEQPQPEPTEHPQPDPTETPQTGNRGSNTPASGCFSCHNSPFAIPGGGGEVAEGLATPGLAGAGYIELLARQITAELQAIRATIKPGEAQPLRVKGIDFGRLVRNHDGTWDTSQVTGLPATSVSTASQQLPSLIVQPFHHTGSFVSLRQFTNNAFEHHHGLQSTEIYGLDIDADEDGVGNELTRADITAITFYQAALAPPGRVIASDPTVAAAIGQGEQLFTAIGCAACHIPQLPLDQNGWIFSEPNPYNPADQLRRGEMPTIQVDLSAASLPGPRLPVVNGVVMVPAYTDFKLHNISDTPGEAGKILTRRLWGAANEPPYFHDGRFNTLRSATLGHAGAAGAARAAFVALPEADQNAVIEFLKSLQVLPPNAAALVIDTAGNPITWPPTEGGR